MKHKLLYIIGMAAALASCSDTWVYTPDASPYLNGEGKTPIEVTALLDAGTASAKTRARDKEFVNGDEFVAYLRHVTWEGESAERISVEADQAPRLVTFTKGDEAMTTDYKQDITPIGTGFSLGIATTEPYNTKATSNLTATPALYWDDFSNSASTETDLRTANHYLQSFYGYCYNGGTPTTNLVNETGVLVWTVQTDQSAAKAFQHSDLLWSAEQTPIAYIHETTRGGLTIPFTHAMSKVTIQVVCADGFDSDATKNFGSAEVTLNQMNTVTTLTAPTATATVGTTPANIKMQKGTPTTKQCSFTALIAPSLFKEGNNLATITGVDGNEYTIPLTDAVLTAATTPAQAWSTQLAAAKVSDADATTVTSYAAGGYTAENGGFTKPGVNYFITVTINKQKITVSAIIKNWDEVSATGVGVIQFTNDISDKTGQIDEILQTNGFYLYKAEANSSEYGVAATKYSYSSAEEKWTRNNEIYWPNKKDKFFFRALSGATLDNEATPENESLTMENGKDVLWGTTKAHSGPEVENPSLTYAEGDPIAPRTGDVPLTFYHPMAKITVNLVDANKDTGLPTGIEASDYANPLNPRLNLAGAKIQITNLSTSGTINLHNGSIIPTTSVAERMFTTDYYAANDADATIPQVEDYVVIPQKFKDVPASGDDPEADGYTPAVPNYAYIIITLADGTTYKVKLNSCETLVTAAIDDTPAEYESIDEWQRGKHYIYTITLAKEEITFRALIKDWEEKTGSGNATLEWD